MIKWCEGNIFVNFDGDFWILDGFWLLWKKVFNKVGFFGIIFNDMCGMVVICLVFVGVIEVEIVMIMGYVFCDVCLIFDVYYLYCDLKFVENVIFKFEEFEK